MTLEGAKAAARKQAFAARKRTKAVAREADALNHLRAALEGHEDQPLAGYMPINTEIDPRPVMAAWRARVGIPVIDAAGQPLRFALWTPDTVLTEGPFGAAIPVDLHPMEPQVLIVPLVAFTNAGARLGYGGGFYDRTLERLRARGPVFAVGFAFEAQNLPALPKDPNDQPLDAIATEKTVRVFTR